MRILIATHNPGKVHTSKILLQKAGIKGISLAEAHLPVIPVQEDGTTPEENARLKAEAYRKRTGMSVFASDSGMEIDGLGGLPGVMVRRWNGRLPDDVSDEDWLNFFLQETKEIPPEQRTGKFITAWAIIHQDRTFTYRVVRSFQFATRKLRPISPGFPMSAIVDTSRTDTVEHFYVPAFVDWVTKENIFNMTRPR